MCHILSVSASALPPPCGEMQQASKDHLDFHEIYTPVKCDRRTVTVNVSART